MDYEEKKSTGENMVESMMFLKDPKIVEILKLCIQPKSDSDMEDILLKFGNKCKELAFFSESKLFWEFDVVCMCVLDYIYEIDTSSLSAVLRSLYLYIKQIKLLWSEDITTSFINSNPDCVLKTLHQITNLRTSSKCEEMLLDIGLACILDGNLGLASFLVKFGLVAFPNEFNEKGKKMVEILVNKFSGTFHHPLRHIQPEEVRTNIVLDKLINQIRRSDINFRRSLLTFCSIILISEYKLYVKVETDSELNSFNETMKRICCKKFMCLKLLIKTTTETKITLKDIENFIARFINPLLNADVGSSLIQASREILCSCCFDYYNPRSLKDLTRCKIRANLQNSMTYPEQVKQLDMPITLKEFLLFHREQIWLLLKLSYVNNENIKQLKLHASLTRALHFYENNIINAI